MQAIKNATGATIKAVKSVFDSDEEDEKKKHEKKIEKNKTKSDKKENDESDSDSDTELAAEIAADIFTGGIYGIVVDSLEAYEAAEEQYHKYRANRQAKKTAEEVKQKEQDTKWCF